MRYGHGPGGLIGLTLNEKAVHIWVMSPHICSRLMKDMADLKDSSSVDITSHKKELPSRIKYDEMTDKSLWKNRSFALIP